MCMKSEEAMTRKEKETKTYLDAGMCDPPRTLSVTCFGLDITHCHISVASISNP